jgi:predicted nuclease of predicted toxin-antitoxin system
MLDENIGGGVARVLVDAGHEVLLSIDSVGVMAPDDVVARAALLSNCVLITGDLDFKRSEKWKSESRQIRYRDLSVILVNLSEPARWAEAVLRYLPLMVFELEHRVHLGGQPWFFCQIQDRWINFMRR